MGRKLAAILAADVVGYSSLMAADENATLAALKAHRRALFEPMIAERGGRIVKLMGDGVLVEFSSVVEAVECAIAIQSAMAEQPGAIRLRIGVNLGDVITEDGDIYGDGVNIAARLEALANPGGICISSIVRESIGKRSAHFVDAGEKRVKGAPRPIRVWQWSAARTAEAGNASAAPGAGLPLPDKPSIAVLPFTNMSGDPEQEYFSDGITEDIITALSKIRWLFVIARNSSFAYKGKSPDIRQIAAELGVRYVLEGSVRRGGQRVRITAQLIDASSGTHVWAERYDRDFENVFALQDEITETLIAAIEPELSGAERRRAVQSPAGSLDAWSAFHRGLWHHYHATIEDNAKAQTFLRKAIELDPDFSRALAGLAHVLYWDVLFGFADDPRAVLEEGLSLARRAVGADDKEPYAHFALGRIATLLGDLDTAIAELLEAISLSPSFAHAHYGLGNALNFAGHPEKAIEAIDRAIRLNPHDPAGWTFFSGRALSLLLMEDYDQALIWGGKAIRQANAGWLSFAILAGIQGQLGKDQEAKETVASTLRLKSDFTVSFIADQYPFRERVHRARFLDALRKAGFPK